MGGAASIEEKLWKRTVPAVDIIKHQRSYDIAQEFHIDYVLHETRFDEILENHSTKLEPREEDIGLELREINKDETIRGCTELNSNRYSQKVWDIIPKKHPKKIHLYEYLASYPSLSSFQDRVAFLMRLVTAYLPENRHIKQYQQPVIKLLDLAMLLHEFECYSTTANSPFDKTKYMLLALSLLTQIPQDNYFNYATLLLTFEEILEKQYFGKPFDQLLHKLEEHELDVNHFSKLIVQLYRFPNGVDESKVGKEDYDLDESGSVLSTQNILQLRKN